MIFEDEDLNGEEFSEFANIEVNFSHRPVTWDIYFSSQEAVKPRQREPLDYSGKSEKNDGMAASEWLYTLCQHFLEESESIFNPLEISQELVNIYKLAQHDRRKEEFFQDKIFQLLGDNCFELLSELMGNYDRLKLVTSSLLVAVDQNTPQESSSEIKDDYPWNTTAATTSATATTSHSSPDWLAHLGFNEDYLLQERGLGLQKGSAFSTLDEQLDHWHDDLLPSGSRVFHEKRGLPAGTEKRTGPGYEEVLIPAATNKPIIPPGGLIEIAGLDNWAQAAFPGTRTLNTIQSIVFPAAYNTAQNLLICAPTGAGKTNIAMLTFLQLVKEKMSSPTQIDRSSVKAIYVAPMKALAQEVVSKFNERLKPLGLLVKEYTGDMQLTKQEIADSNLIVTTPEKYDVISRKGGEGSLSTMISLIIIDEVHLLADDRGAVIETIVARTHRYIESAQKRIRLVGLSATLPNYEDVAKFLKVNAKTGLFHFGPEYRPVPLKQTFIGVTEKVKAKRNDFMNKKAYEQMVTALENDKQVMIFVHSRKETSKTAQAMIDLCGMHGTLGLLDNAHHEQYGLWKKDVDKSPSLEVQNFFYKGVGIHHAGLTRSDRNLTEDLFQFGLIRVLCCTATLAWGVNLPAHTVIIKGTELYDPERGGFVDLSMLDVLQIFGRAGRPQYDNTGHAILITPHKTLDHYLGLLGSQSPIESALIKSLADHLNAEVVNATVNNIKDAVSWLSYTFLFVRMCKNPQAYGLNYEDVFNDPQLTKKRIDLITEAAQVLDRCMMCRYDPRSGNLGVTDLGRVASHYYIKHGSIEAFNSMLNPYLNDVDALHVLCSSVEFDQLKMRPEELEEMDSLKKNSYLRVKIPIEETAGKVNVLLQNYLGQHKITSFTLQSDTNYVSQNAGRISRALFELCLKRGWSTMASHYLELCKGIDRRIRPDQTPLRQFIYDEVPRDVVRRLEDLKANMNTIGEMSAKEVGELIRNQKYGGKVLSLVNKLPRMNIEVHVQTITRGILKLQLFLTGGFEWTDRYHGLAEPFWIWVEDGENEYIYHSENFLLSKKQKDVTHQLEFTIPVREPLPPQYYVRIVSDRWVGCSAVHAVSFQHLILPDRMPPHTNLLDVHPVPKSALNNKLYESLFPRFSHFNPIQSQVFHALYHTDHNILVGAPTGSGKTIISELSILRLLNTRPKAKIVYVAPLKALARERVDDWRVKLGEGLGLKVLELTGDFTPDAATLNEADLLIVTPEKWDSISRGWQRREYVQRVELFILDEIHLLGVERGAVLEVIVSRMRFVSAQMQHPIRFVGLSTALANPRDLADWMGIGQVGVYNFRPSVRPIPMTIHIQGFPGKHYCPRMATMNKPTYAAICEHSPTKPSLVFVSSRRQTRLTALDLISYCASDDNPKRFLHTSEEEIEAIAETIKDQALKNTIVFGIAIHHAGLDNHDRKTVESLYLNGKIQVLVATSTLAWGVNLPCHLVIVKGTEFFDGKLGRYVNFEVTDILQMMGRAGRPQFDDTGVACVFVHEPLKNFYRKFLFEPFPVESSLQKQLHEHINAEVVTGVLNDMHDCLEYLSWTYYFRRLAMNPSYYQLNDCTPEGVTKHLSTLLWGVLNDLQQHKCIEVDRSRETFAPTTLGKITSYYYLHYRTALLFQNGLKAIAEGKNKHSKAKSSTANVNSSSLEPYCKLIADAYEFSEIPVRHNEDLLNAELAEMAPWKVDPTTFSESNTKAFLLLQAHMYQLPLPIVDYINDTKSVMEQFPRVLNALVDIAADAGNNAAVLALAKLSQLVAQKMSVDASELVQLEGIHARTDLSLFRSKGIRTVRDLIQSVSSSSSSSSSSESRKKSSVDVNAFQSLFLGNADQFHSFKKAVQDFPLFTSALKIRKGNESWTPIVTENAVVPAATGDSAANNNNNKFSLELTITQSHGQTEQRGGRKAAKRSWWIVVSVEGNGSAVPELCAIKRINGTSSRTTTTVDFVLPTINKSDDNDGENKITVTVDILCDAIVGLDMKHAFMVK